MPATTGAMFRFPHNVQAVLQQIRQGLGIQGEQTQLGDAVALLDDHDRWVEDNLSQLDDRLTHLDSGLGAVSLIPPGAMVDFGGATAPPGWLLCNGAPVLRATYPALFTAIGVLWGPGDGSTTFNVPDFRGRVTIGAGTGVSPALTPRALAARGGEETHLLTANESGLQNHTHQFTADSGFPVGVQTGSGAVTDANATGTTAGSGAANASTAHNTMQPFAVVTKIIKT